MNEQKNIFVQNQGFGSKILSKQNAEKSGGFFNKVFALTVHEIPGLNEQKWFSL
jgi:hypothetical protein